MVGQLTVPQTRLYERARERKKSVSAERQKIVKTASQAIRRRVETLVFSFVLRVQLNCTQFNYHWDREEERAPRWERQKVSLTKSKHKVCSLQEGWISCQIQKETSNLHLQWHWQNSRRREDDLNGKFKSKAVVTNTKRRSPLPHRSRTHMLPPAVEEREREEKIGMSIDRPGSVKWSQCHY